MEVETVKAIVQEVFYRSLENANLQQEIFKISKPSYKILQTNKRNKWHK